MLFRFGHGVAPSNVSHDLVAGWGGGGGGKHMQHLVPNNVAMGYVEIGGVRLARPLVCNQTAARRLVGMYSRVDLSKY